jgi:hypothetical protein
MPDAIPVTTETFIRAETDMYFGNVVKDGGFGKFHHNREPADVAHQTVVRMNRDTLYSSAVFDLDAGSVTITLSDAGKRFMSMQVFDEDEYTPAVYYGGGSHTLTREQIGTRYACVALRIFVNPSNPRDVKQVHALQDAVKAEQNAFRQFETPKWDATSQKRIREALMVLGESLPDARHMFGDRKAEIDPVRRLIGAATGWGGNPEKEAMYDIVTPKKNDGKTVYHLKVKDVPVEGFWSVTVYNKDGYLEPNARNAYSLNNVTAKKDADGSVAIQFGGCEGNVVNCIPITPGWGYVVRLYRPRPEILNGSWTFPDAIPV